MKTFLLLLDGMTGAGKTTTSMALAKKIPRMATIGMDKVKWFVSDFERGERDNAIAREIVFEMAKKYLDLGLSVIIDQPFKTKEEIGTYDELAKNHSVQCYKFQLFTDPETAINRVRDRQKDRENKVPEERVKRNIALFEDRKEFGFEVIDTTNKEPEYAAGIILEKLC